MTSLAATLIASGAAVIAAGIFGWQCREILTARARAERAQRRFDLLHNLAPALTAPAAESTTAACARILDRFASLVGAQTMLCFYDRDDRLILGAKAGSGYVGFLREGEPYAGGAIVGWSSDHIVPAIVGPTAARVSSESGITDLGLERHRDDPNAGPVAGSRDRVWALAIPLVRHRGYGLRPQIIGMLYAERLASQRFSNDELATALTVAQLASDALARAVFADQVRRESERDQLTQLYTPSRFRRLLRDEIEGRRFAGGLESRDVGLLFIDTDNFKTWNDTFGHAAGDRLLRALADAFADTAARADGFAGRNGGDEFCIALRSRTKDATIALAEGVRGRIESSDFNSLLHVAGAPIEITISVGVAHFPVDVLANEPNPSDRLLEAADANMYAAKRLGRNRVEWTRSAPATRRM